MTRRLWQGLQRHSRHSPEHLKTVGFKSNTKCSAFVEAVWEHYLAANTCALWTSVWRTERSLPSTEKTSTEIWMLTPVSPPGRWPLQCCHRKEMQFWLAPCKPLNLWESVRVGKAALHTLGMTWLSWPKKGHCCPQRSTARIPGNPGQPRAMNTDWEGF